MAERTSRRSTFAQAPERLRRILVMPFSPMRGWLARMARTASVNSACEILGVRVDVREGARGVSLDVGEPADDRCPERAGAGRQPRIGG